MDVNKFERARLIGARALQLAEGAPPLVEVKATAKAINPIMIAFEEFEKNVLPIAVVKSS